jgi:hypothetical protein
MNKHQMFLSWLQTKKPEINEATYSSSAYGGRYITKENPETPLTGAAVTAGKIAAARLRENPTDERAAMMASKLGLGVRQGTSKNVVIPSAGGDANIFVPKDSKAPLTLTRGKPGDIRLEQGVNGRVNVEKSDLTNTTAAAGRQFRALSYDRLNQIRNKNSVNSQEQTFE